MPNVALRIAVVHGPNLNLLGTREPGLYGNDTLDDINVSLSDLAVTLGVKVCHFQSNHEGAMIDHIQSLRGTVAGVVINAAALTHTSVGIRDALLALGVPFVEVHLSNIFSREEFRHRSLLADAAIGVVCGFGAYSYGLGLEGLAKCIRRADKCAEQ